MQVSLDNDSIIISFRYDPAIVQYIRLLPGRVFVASGKYWKLPVNSIKEATLHNLEKLGFSIDPRIFDALATSRTQANELDRLQGQPDTPLDTTLPLLPTQRV